MLTPRDPGLSNSEFKKVKIHMLYTGEFNPNLWNELSERQKFWVNQTKLALRELQRENETNERNLENITRTSKLPSK